MGEVREVSAARLERPTICVLALSAIADDPRVRRQAEAFHRAGWNVTAVGLPGARSAAPEWRILTAEEFLMPRVKASDCGVTPAVHPGRPFLPKALRLVGRLAYRLPRALLSGRVRYALRLLAVRARPAIAQGIYWSFSENIIDIYNSARQVTAAVWLANDWTMLPLAARLAREKGGIYCYDTHEFAAEEYGDDRSWRLWRRPMVCALEREFIGRAAVVSAVSAGIAERLGKLYQLPAASITIRNTPAFEPIAFHSTSPDCIRVLYHGIVTPGRGLEATIDSVAAWRPQFDLTIRGPGDGIYLAALRNRICERGLTDRITIAPPVPMTALVREAAAFDIGFFALPGSSRHNEFALPNKFFEYIMAGLALCLTDLPEMSRLVRQYGLGVTFRTVAPEAIATAINGLDPASIDHYKRNALAAARELSWERESERLLSAYNALLGRAATQVA
jgi:glycosyltransferase involved in cell wall biosynthesis